MVQTDSVLAAQVEVAAEIALVAAAPTRCENIYNINELLFKILVALFSPGSNELRDEFNKALAREAEGAKAIKSSSGSSNPTNKERLAKILSLMSELKKEVEALQKEIK